MTVGIIPARGGSKGIPRKNIKSLLGKPLIAYTIKTALRCSLIDRVIVSTDDEEIANVARKYGAEVPFMRPRHLALDTTPTLPVLQHAVSYIEENEGVVLDTVVLLEPTSPLRDVGYIDACIQKLQAEDADSVVTVCEVEHNPYFVMLRIENGRYVPLIEPSEPVMRRQDAPKVYRLNGAVYAVKRDVLMERNEIFKTENTKVVIVPQEKSFSIDQPLDFEIVEFLLKKRIL